MSDFDKSLSEQSSAGIQVMNDAVHEFRKQVHAHLKSCGFVRKVSTQSALYQWQYTREKRIVTIDGWHGTGKRGTCRWFGDGCTFFDLYDNEFVQKEKYKPVVSCKGYGKKLDEVLAAHTKAMKTALEYVRGIR